MFKIILFLCDFLKKKCLVIKKNTCKENSKKIFKDFSLPVGINSTEFSCEQNFIQRTKTVTKKIFLFFKKVFKNLKLFSTIIVTA